MSHLFRFVAFYVLNSPLGAFFLACFLLHPSWQWLICFFISALVAHLILGVGGLLVTVNNNEVALSALLENPGNFTLEEEGDISALIPNVVSDRLLFRKGFSLNWVRKG